MKKIKKIQIFFEHYIKIAGELDLYRNLFGELPTNDDSTARILELQKMAKEARPLLDELNIAFERSISATFKRKRNKK